MPPGQSCGVLSMGFIPFPTVGAGVLTGWLNPASRLVEQESFAASDM